MLRLLIFALLMALFVYLVKEKIRSLISGASHSFQQDAAGRAKASAVAFHGELVGCAVCGVHIPREGAAGSKGQWYCSSACRQRAEAHCA